MNNFKKNILKISRPVIDILPTLDFDYAVFTYKFLDGLDLDTRTRMIYPNLGSNEYVGWNKEKSKPFSGSWSGTVIPTNAILDWGDDNTGIGYESVLLDLNNFKLAFPFYNTIVLEMRCGWYKPDGSPGSIGTLPVQVQAVFYKGGTMIKGNPNLFEYTNPTAIDTQIFNTPSKIITERIYNTTPLGSGNIGEGIAIFNYSILTGVGSFS